MANVSWSKPSTSGGWDTMSNWSALPVGEGFLGQTTAGIVTLGSTNASYAVTFNVANGTGAVPCAEIRNGATAEASATPSLLVGLDGGGVISVDPTTGAVTPLTTIPNFVAYPLGAEAATNGHFYFDYETSFLGSPFILDTVDLTTDTITNSITTTAGNFVADNLTGQLVGLDGGGVISVDPTTGAVTPLITIPNLVAHLGAEAATNGHFYFEYQTSTLGPLILDTVDLTTDTITNSVTTTAGNFVADNLTGQLVGLDGGGVISVDPTTGAVTPLTTIPNFVAYPLGAEAATNGHFYFDYETSFLGSPFILDTVDLTTDTITNSITTTAGNFVADNLTGQLVGLDGGGVISVDPTTGAVTPLITIPNLVAHLGAEAATNGHFYFEYQTSTLGPLILDTVDLTTDTITNSVTTTAGNFVADNLTGQLVGLDGGGV